MPKAQKQKQGKIQGVRGFFTDVTAEIKKCSWPERRELVESTIVVIVSMALLCVFVGVSDWLLIRLLRLVIPTG